jgi:hypothetical protein
MNSLATITANIGTRVGDTSALFATIINGYVKQRYQMIFKRYNFINTINSDFSLFTIPIVPDNLLSNGSFETWAASLPTGWTLTGVGAAVAQSTTVDIGTYAAQITSASATASLTQDFSVARGISYWYGRTVTIGGYINTSATLGSISMTFSDGIKTQTVNPTISGAYTYVSITQTISGAATQCLVSLNVGTGSLVALFDGFIATEGFTVVQNEWDLPSDFGKELYVYDTLNQINLDWRSLQDVERIYLTADTTDDELDEADFYSNGVTAPQGYPYVYSIYNYIDNTNPTTIRKRIRLWPVPTQSIQLSIPYIIQGALVNTTDLPILELADTACELGATADAWRTKRQFAKAADFEGVPNMIGYNYEGVLATMIWSEENQVNRPIQFTPNVYPKNMLY